MSHTGIGPYIRQLRDKRGWTQAQLGDSVGVAAARIAQIEGGQTKLPGADIRRRLAAALGVSHLDLLIAAGEITAEEIEGKQGKVERDPNDPLQQLIDAAERVPDRRRLRGVAVMLESWRDEGV